MSIDWVCCFLQFVKLHGGLWNITEAATKWPRILHVVFVKLLQIVDILLIICNIHWLFYENDINYIKVLGFGYVVIDILCGTFYRWWTLKYEREILT